jgi:hypothetical protein
MPSGCKKGSDGLFGNASSAARCSARDATPFATQQGNMELDARPMYGSAQRCSQHIRI